MIEISRSAVMASLEIFYRNCNGGKIQNMCISDNMIGLARDWFARCLGWVRTSDVGYRYAGGGGVVDVPLGEAIAIDLRRAYRLAKTIDTTTIAPTDAAAVRWLLAAGVEAMPHDATDDGERQRFIEHRGWTALDYGFVHGKHPTIHALRDASRIEFAKLLRESADPDRSPRTVEPILWDMHDASDLIRGEQFKTATGRMISLYPFEVF
jgi:hypothetical protein